jgi:hypothetical protein
MSAGHARFFCRTEKTYVSIRSRLAWLGTTSSTRDYKTRPTELLTAPPKIKPVMRRKDCGVKPILFSHKTSDMELEASFAQITTIDVFAP